MRQPSNSSRPDLTERLALAAATAVRSERQAINHNPHKLRTVSVVLVVQRGFIRVSSVDVSTEDGSA